MTTLAEKTKQLILSTCPATFSLYAGYGMIGGQYVRFPTGIQEVEKRNDKGQVSMSRYRYADGSTLTYKRKPDNQYSLIVGCSK